MPSTLSIACGYHVEVRGITQGKHTAIPTLRALQNSSAGITHHLHTQFTHYCAQLSHKIFGLSTSVNTLVVHIFHTTNNKSHELEKKNKGFII